MKVSCYYLRHTIPLNNRIVSAEVLKFSKICNTTDQPEEFLEMQKGFVKQIRRLAINAISPE